MYCGVGNLDVLLILHTTFSLTHEEGQLKASMCSFAHVEASQYIMQQRKKLNTQLGFFYRNRSGFSVKVQKTLVSIAFSTHFDWFTGKQQKHTCLWLTQYFTVCYGLSQGKLLHISL